MRAILLVPRLVVEHTVTIAFVIGIGNLILELLTDALVGRRGFQFTGTVAAFPLQSFSNSGYEFLILIQANTHYSAS